MALGPGKYDALCSLAREQTQADGVIVMVVNGNKGTGFSCQANAAVTLALPGILENLAAEIRAGFKAGQV